MNVGSDQSVVPTLGPGHAAISSVGPSQSNERPAADGWSGQIQPNNHASYQQNRENMFQFLFPPHVHQINVQSQFPVVFR